MWPSKKSIIIIEPDRLSPELARRGESDSAYFRRLYKPLRIQ
jgi:hypothetical protein